MGATDFEFRYRFLIVSAIFFLAFSCYAFDRTNVAVALLQVVVGPGFSPVTPEGRRALRTVFGGGALLVAVAAGLRTWATAFLESEVVHDAHLRTEGLVADGPYRHVRNPLYLANVPMAVGMGLLASRTGFLILVVGSTLFVRRLITREESDLALAQGQRYRDYCGAVPRLLPSLKPRLPPGGRTPRWGQAVAGEIFFWIFAAATAALPSPSASVSSGPLSVPAS